MEVKWQWKRSFLDYRTIRLVDVNIQWVPVWIRIIWYPLFLFFGKKYTGRSRLAQGKFKATWWRTDCKFLAPISQVGEVLEQQLFISSEVPGIFWRSQLGLLTGELFVKVWNILEASLEINKITNPERKKLLRLTMVGTNGGGTLLISKSSQLTFRKKACFFTSSASLSLAPNLLSGFFLSS